MMEYWEQPGENVRLLGEHHATGATMQPKITNLYVVAGLATIGGLIQGFDVSSMSAILATPQYKAYFHNPGAVEAGAITASMAAGSLLGALASAWTGDRIGRRDSLLCGCAVFVAGSALMCAVRNVAMLVAARVVNGFAVGMMTSQGPIFLAEISPPALRGRLVALQQWMITWGILVMYFVEYGAASVPGPTSSFRLPWGLQAIPALLLAACLPWMPRSPRWLAGQDRWEEARRALAVLRGGGGGDGFDSQVETELAEIRERVRLERQYKNTGWAELFNRRNLIRVHCAVFAHIWSQYCGINALMYYIVYIFEMAGLGQHSTLVSAAIQYALNVAMTVPALLLLDRVPRRAVLLGGALAMAAWLFATGAIMAVYGEPASSSDGNKTVTWTVTRPAASRAVIACSYLFVATYAATWGPAAWVYPPEVVPLYLRSRAVALATVANWGCNFSLTFFTPPAFEHIQWRIYLIFGTFCLAAFVHVFLFFQETRGRTLEEMDDVFDNNVFAFFGETKQRGVGAAATLDDDGVKQDARRRRRLDGAGDVEG